MPITLKVTLKTVNGVKCLDVDDANNANHVPQSPQIQSIVWQLEGDAASGSFCALNGTPPGFAWLPTAPSSTIFGSPSLSNNGNTMTISDLNNSTSTQGAWKYKICASVGGTTYCTTATTPMATSNNPTIKNN